MILCLNLSQSMLEIRLFLELNVRETYLFSRCSCFLCWFMRSSLFGKTSSFLCFRIFRVWRILGILFTTFYSSLLILFCLYVCRQERILSNSAVPDFITLLTWLSPLISFILTKEIWLKHLLELLLAEHPRLQPLLRLIFAEIFCLKEDRNSPPRLIVIFFNALRFWCLELKVFLFVWVRRLVDPCDIGIFYLTTMVLDLSTR